MSAATCPPATPATLTQPGDKTVSNNVNLAFSITATDSAACAAPSFTVSSLPSGASFNSTPSGNSRTGNFSWTPSGQAGTYPVRFTATDSDNLVTSLLIRIYVAGVGEQLNGQGVPVSQTNWSPVITNIALGSGNNITVVWDSVSGVPYDVYYSDNNFGGSMTWTKTVDGAEADSSLESTTLTAAVNQRFYQVTLPGQSPNSNNVWGVIRPTVNGGTFTMIAPPLDGDRKFNGAFGTNLALALSNGDEVHIYESPSTWITLTLSGGVWTDGGPSTYELAPGQGFFVYRPGSTVQPRLTGPVGNRGAATNTIAAGDWNIIGLSQGKYLSLSSAFGAGNLTQGTLNESWDETAADIVVVQNGTAWRRIIRAGNSTWFDLSTFSTTSYQFAPGQAVYFFRQGVTDLKVKF